VGNDGGYTVIPNCLPDIYMQKVSDIQYKVLECIVRKTLGWHKIWDAIPLSQFEDMMGNSRPAIVRAIADLIELKIILCGKGKGRSASEYALNPGFDSFELMVKHFNQLTKLTSKAELPLAVNQINCYALVVVNQINPQKKDLNKTKNNKDVVVDLLDSDQEPPVLTINSDARIIEGAILQKYRTQIMDRPPSPNALRDALESYTVDQLGEAIERMPIVLKPTDPTTVIDGNYALSLACGAAKNPHWWRQDDGGNGGAEGITDGERLAKWKADMKQVLDDPGQYPPDNQEVISYLAQCRNEIARLEAT